MTQDPLITKQFEVARCSFPRHRRQREHNGIMADKEDKNEENIGGKFYVDSQCIDCDLCRETAPSNFTRADDEGYSFVFKQPENANELEQCKEAMEGCPVEAIGEDGDE